MALYRWIVEISNPKEYERDKWAFVERSDENKNHLIILGNKTFDTEDEAREWSKGFEINSYTRKDPLELKYKNLMKRRDELLTELSYVETDLHMITEELNQKYPQKEE